MTDANKDTPPEASDQPSPDDSPKDAPEGQAEDESSSPKEEPEAEPKPASEPSKSEAEPAAPADHDKRFLGIKVHHWIFVGIIAGVLLGWFTHNLDHSDSVVLKKGEVTLRGKIRKTSSEYVILNTAGDEERVAIAAVKTYTPHAKTDSGWLYETLMWWYDLLGKVIFMGALKMLIAPLILGSIIAGVVSLKDLDQLKSIGFKTIAYYVCTTTIAVTIGLVAVLVIRPGHKAAAKEINDKRQAELNSYQQDYEQSTGEKAFDKDKPKQEYLQWVAEKEAKRAGSGHEAERFKKISAAEGSSALDKMRDGIVKPMLTNPFESLTERKSLGIIFFALLFGIAVVFVGEPAKPVADFFLGFNEVIIKITTWLMTLAPICIMFIVAHLIGTYGPNVFGSLAWYCVTVIVGIAIHVGVLLAIAAGIAGVTPRQLWSGLREAWLVAFTTRSSAATLPITMRCVIENLGVSPRIANFGLPLGATMNMDGTALYEGVAVIFLIQMYSGCIDNPVALGGAVTLIIFVTAVLASIGAAAVPDAGLVTMVLVAESVGFPVYYIPILFAVDAFLDMFRTSTNVLGDAIGTLVVQKLEGG